MATRNDIEPMVISRDEYIELFGDSDFEDDEERDQSDIDVGDFESESSEEEDVDNEAAVPTNTWRSGDDLKDITVEDFNSPAGKTFQIADGAIEKDVFDVLFKEDMMTAIVEESNLYARQKLADKATRLAAWKDITLAELKAFFGVQIFMGINSLPCIADYWSSDPFIGNEGIKGVMTKNRFEEISRYLHFNNTAVEPRRGEDGYDRLYKVRPIINFFNERTAEIYNPHRDISVDEGMIAFKGRLGFRQYMPNKPVKYGIKVWMAADATNGFVLNHKVYLGKEEETSGEGLGYDVVFDLTRPFFNKYHHVYFDNYFCGIKLQEDLLANDTYACGTVRLNRKGLPEDAKNKLKKGEIIVCQKDEGNMVFTKWHDKRDVTLLSTNCSPKDPPVDVERRKKNGELEVVQKPKPIIMYNKYMGGVDRSDQIRSYYNTCRPSKKWYKYIFWFIFEVILGNSYTLYREHVIAQNKRYNVKAFRLQLARQLIAGYSSRGDNRKRSLQAASVSQCISPENVSKHYIDQRSGRKRQCVQCKRAGRTTKSDRAVETTYYCVQCGISLCKVPCFAEYHGA